MVSDLKKKCVLCGKAFEIQAEFESVAKYVKACPACSEKQVQAEDDHDREKRRQRAAAEQWEKMCPPDFMEIEFSRLPRQKAFTKVQEWKFGKRGMILHGPTGHGKSRSLYTMLMREHFSGRTVKIIDHSSAFQYAATFSQSAADAWEWVKDKSECELLAMDDVFKVKLSESFEQAIFTIISTRTEWGRPILLTTQDLGKTLEARMSPDRGPALVRRLRDFCDSVSFS